MYLICGLGNPGKEYEITRHNVGFSVVDALAVKYSLQIKEDKIFSSAIGKSENLVLIKPITYMNNSGIAVQKVLNWFKLPVENMIVIHDEIALDLGRIRISKNRGAGGHHGIESIISHLSGSKDFIRIRVGIGPDPGGDIRSDYVLGKFNNKDKEIFNKVTDICIEAVEMILNAPIEEVMNKYNGMEAVQ